MNMNANIGDGMAPRSVLGCMALALLATTISLSLSVLTAWQVGVSFPEKLTLAAFGVLAVLGAHLLLAICQPALIRVRLVAAMLWLCCIMYVAYSHATFFLALQQQAGMRRVAAVEAFSSASPPKRTLTAILADQERIKTALATKAETVCADGCSRLKIQMTSLNARLDILDAEADEVRRWQAQQDRQQGMQDALRDDPVTAHLAKISVMFATHLRLVTALLFALILEGIACLCWWLGFRLRDSAVTATLPQPVMPIPTSSPAGHDESGRTVSELDNQVEELLSKVKAGRVKLTVSSVRSHCQCAQKKAAELKRLVEARLHAEVQYAD